MFPLTTPYTVLSSSMTECADTCQKLTFNLCVLEGSELCQNILIHLQMCQTNRSQDKGSLLSSELQVEHHSFESAMVENIYDCAYKVIVKGRTT